MAIREAGREDGRAICSGLDPRAERRIARRPAGAGVPRRAGRVARRVARGVAKGLVGAPFLAILVPSGSAAEGAPADQTARSPAFVARIEGPDRAPVEDAVAAGTVGDFPGGDPILPGSDSFSSEKRFEARFDRVFEATSVASREIELPTPAPLVIALGETPPPRPPARPEPDPLQSLFGTTTP